ncbi:MAG TPA: GMP synthase [Phycisphaerales bacterium]|nr:GMP synthase [Phycisphaerales bacterium]
MAIIVFQHSDSNRPGRLGLTLRDQAFRLDVRRLDKGDPVPGDYDGVDGVIALGGPQNVGGKEHWLQKEIEYLRGAHERALPVVGVCLGHQLLGAALGAEVGPMEKPESGMSPVDLTVAGQTDTVLAGIAWRSHQFQSHGYEVKSVPPDGVLLATSARCKVQCFRAGLRTYGFQYHFEADRSMIGEIAGAERDICARAGTNAEEISRQCDRHYESFARLGDRLCLNIATYLIPRVATMVG